jgi:hypothetical protein
VQHIGVWIATTSGVARRVTDGVAAGDEVEEVIEMTLPDYWTGISAQMTTFMEWTTVATPVALIVGTAVACVMLAMLLGVFKHH